MGCKHNPLPATPSSQPVGFVPCGCGVVPTSGSTHSLQAPNVVWSFAGVATANEAPVATSGAWHQQRHDSPAINERTCEADGLQAPMPCARQNFAGSVLPTTKSSYRRTTARTRKHVSSTQLIVHQDIWVDRSGTAIGTQTTPSWTIVVMSLGILEHVVGVMLLPRCMGRYAG